jgi:hypothetical protein
MVMSWLSKLFEKPKAKETHRCVSGTVIEETPRPQFANRSIKTNPETGHTDVNDKAIGKTQTAYFDCTPPSGNGRCSDNACPCPEVEIPRGKGYLFIGQDLVDFRRKYPGEEQAGAATESRMRGAGFSGGFYSISPVLVCEQGAKLRNLDLKVAADDAAHWWAKGKVPLRATPISGRQTTADPLETIAQSTQNAGPALDVPAQARAASVPHPGRESSQPACKMQQAGCAAPATWRNHVGHYFCDEHKQVMDVMLRLNHLDPGWKRL